MSNVRVVFEILDHNQPAPIGCKASSSNLVSDVKTKLKRKDWWVKYGHKTSEPDQYTYAGVVSRDSVRIALIYAAFNRIGVMAADINNAYLQDPSSDKHYLYLWGWLWSRTHRQDCHDPLRIIWRQIKWSRLMETSPIMHDTSRVHVLLGRPWYMDVKINKVWYLGLLEICSFLYVDDALCISMNSENVT